MHLVYKVYGFHTGCHESITFVSSVFFLASNTVINFGLVVKPYASDSNLKSKIQPQWCILPKRSSELRWTRLLLALDSAERRVSLVLKQPIAKHNKLVLVLPACPKRLLYLWLVYMNQGDAVGGGGGHPLLHTYSLLSQVMERLFLQLL